MTGAGVGAWPLSQRRRRRLTVAAALCGFSAWPLAVRAALPDIIAASRASVVPVGTFNVLDNPRFSFRGSGFAVGDGTRIVTNYHVLPEATGSRPGQLAVLVPRAGGGVEARPAQLVASERAHDLAVLQIENALQPLALDDQTTVREGTEVALMGFPLAGTIGFSPVTHRGIVASITAVALPAMNARQLDGKLASRLREGPLEIYQLDAVAYPGNSGGPLLDATNGRVVGVVNMVLFRSTRESMLTQPSGISYAIPVRFVRELLAR